MKTGKTVVILIMLVTILSSCSSNDSVIKEAQATFGIFKVSDDQKSIEMNGTINSSSLVNYNKLYTKYPKIKTINIKNCDGSSDDEINLKLSKRVHDLNIDIHLLDNAEIASGGVDFFLAGIKRTRGSNTKIGVHSWAGDNTIATDFPVGHANHLPYINYYKSIGFSDVDAKAFYYFTINAAPANSIHWMTEEEIIKYKMLKL
ncbi:alpha/beta hydrolase [Tenacibaculum sp. S7007]|uniref:Alpha/beta hydrolase n=1 Tax=Tenacibaculum pelagium TaxID=2759527 RepID=A0A839APX0_9FLAO|nr:alpha/beta hydrolase [Tenacibaculum pelagium]MBA6156259.1 alpha/beta hydrolase [Tenacibaculum pelagium]